MSKNKRSAISKGKRFDLFKRDGFTCQYCGRRPPEITLEIDHILPIIEGGNNDEMNLVSACMDCNRGKGKKLLDKPQRSDAELAWLEVQQEIAEMKHFQKVKRFREKAIQHTIAILQGTWKDNSDLDWAPSENFIRPLLKKYSLELIDEAFANLAYKVSNGYVDEDGWFKYCHAMLRNMESERTV